MNIGFIGAGRVGCSLGKYLIMRGFLVSGYYSRSEESACIAAELTETVVFGSEEELIKNSDVIFLTVPDGMISTVWEKISKLDLNKKTICHCSGALSSGVFAGPEEMGRVSLHPLMAVSTREHDLSKAFFTVEGNESGREKIEQILCKCGNPYQEIDAASKVKYHAGAAVASNLVTGVLDMAIQMFVDCGFSEEKAREALRPLVTGNAEAVMDMGAANALTGPVSRRDYETVEKHMKVLSGEELEIYRLLSLRLLDMTGDKNASEYMKVKGVLLK